MYASNEQLGIAETPEQNQLAKGTVTKKEPSIAQMDNFKNMVGIRFSAEKAVIYDLNIRDRYRL